MFLIGKTKADALTFWNLRCLNDPGISNAMFPANSKVFLISHERQEPRPHEFENSGFRRNNRN